MASSIAFSTDRPSGPKSSTEWIKVHGRDKKLIHNKGFSRNTVTLLGDSIIQRMKDMLVASVQAIPGSYLRDMVEMCTNGIYDVKSFSAVVVCGGTNDFSNSSEDQIFSSFTALVAYIRVENPTCLIAICGILPRPCDWRSPEKQKARMRLNTHLLLLCRSLNVDYFKTDAALKGKGPYSLLYHTDYLHLSDTGVHYLMKWMEGRIGRLLGDPHQVPPHDPPHDPPLPTNNVP
jgi:hypothetical protein